MGRHGGCDIAAATTPTFWETSLANPIIREKLDRREFFVAPGMQDMISAVIADRVGFEIVYGTGYWLTASALGLPDAGIASYTQMVDRMATLCRTTKAAVIADADTGYGGLLNMHHTVRGYEAVGVSAIQIEDQEFPKKCGHTPFKRIVPVADMVEKIKVAVAARRDPNFLVIARTDARQSEGLDGALRRLDAYSRSRGGHPVSRGPDHRGGDADRLRRLRQAGDGQHGRRRPHARSFPPTSLSDIGYAFAIYPSHDQPRGRRRHGARPDGA